MVASKVSSEIYMIAASLQLDHCEVDQITRDNQHCMQEKNFHLPLEEQNKRKQGYVVKSIIGCR